MVAEQRATVRPCSSELARPEHFEALTDDVGYEAIESSVICAVDAEPVIQAVDRFVAAGYDSVYLHQVGPISSAWRTSPAPS